MVINVPVGVKPLLAKSIGYGLWGGGLGGCALVMYNVSRYGGSIPGMGERAAIICGVAIVGCGGAGWLFWSGMILRD